MENILVTGATGFLGKVVVRQLEEVGWSVYQAKGKKHFDFRGFDETIRCFEKAKPDVVIHLAATVGGIGANSENPGSFFYDNISMGINLIEVARQFKVKKFILLGTVCMYPCHTPVPFSEKDLWNGYPEVTNAAYGIAKKSLMEMLRAYKKQYGFNGITLIPTNLYGPGDNYNENTSHVIPALIKKFSHATSTEKHGNVIVWGSGYASREFLYVDDCARAVVKSIVSYGGDSPLNLGTGRPILISDLVNKIAKLFNFKGNILYDTTKPDGQPKRCLDVSLAKSVMGFEPSTNFDIGLKQTIDSYKVLNV